MPSRHISPHYASSFSRIDLRRQRQATRGDWRSKDRAKQNPWETRERSIRSSVAVAKNRTGKLSAERPPMFSSHPPCLEDFQGPRMCVIQNRELALVKENLEAFWHFCDAESGNSHPISARLLVSGHGSLLEMLKLFENFNTFLHI